ncbi:MAG: DUF58 domain-containing protein, partial [Armatimonadota bacterium]|nr:DUF58 domain-containing protein [Armatimonadota bacterium]
MNAPRSSGLFRWLPAAALVALVPLLGYPYLLLVLLVLGLNLTVTAARPAPYELFVTVVTLIALPYAGGAVLPGPARPLALLLILLGLPWLDGALRRCAGWAVRSSPGAAVVPLPGRRGMTPLLAALGTGLTLAAGAGLTARQPLMAAATAILLGAVTARALVSYVRLAPHRSLSSRVWTVRVLAGHPATATATLTSGAPWPLRVALRLSEPWAVLDTPDFLLPARGERAVALHLRPPLAGPDRVTATATAWDPWGLIVQRQRVVLAEVRVIPRAAYAAWLAQRYLEQAQDGALPAPAITEPKQAQAARRGLDYYGARLYEPGDALRDVFWKPTIKLGQIVVKDRRQGRGEPVVASVNLLAADAEEKDRLAHALLTSVLTLAREGVPVALAAYAPEGVVEVTPPLAPQPALRAALSLLDRIRTAPRPLRVLAP